MKWYIPSYGGDYRFEVTSDETCILTVHDPTPAELKRLGPFLEEARKRGWIDPYEGISVLGKSVLSLRASLATAGSLLVGKTKKKRGLLTALASEDGEVVAVYDTSKEGALSLAKGGEMALADPAGEGALSEPTAAVTTEQPNLGSTRRGDCPESLASEVLQAFSTPEQWRCWLDRGYMVAYGHLTGHAYRLAHRKLAVGQKQGRVAYDLDDSVVLDAWDWMLPPPEEVLAIKLCVEHREPWVRNPNGVDVSRARHVFANPFPENNGDRDEMSLRALERAYFPILAALGRSKSAV